MKKATALPAEFPIFSTQVDHARQKKKKFLWRPEDKEIECSQAGAASWISLSFWIPKNSRSPIEMRLMTCLQEGSSKNNTYNKKSAGSQNLPRWFFWLSLLPPTKDP